MDHPYGQGEPSYPGSGGNGGVSETSVYEKASGVKGKIADVGRKAMEKVNEQRRTAASTLDTAASSLHQGADTLRSGVERRASDVAGVAHATADKIQATAEYIRHHEVGEIWGDIDHLVRRYPGPSMLAAAGLGFLLGKLFSRD